MPNSLLDRRAGSAFFNLLVEFEVVANCRARSTARSLGAVTEPLAVASGSNVNSKQYGERQMGQHLANRYVYLNARCWTGVTSTASFGRSSKEIRREYDANSGVYRGRNRLYISDGLLRRLAARELVVNWYVNWY